MSNEILPHKRWQQLFDIQLIFGLLILVLEISNTGFTAESFGRLIILILLIGLNIYLQLEKTEKKVLFEFVSWLNLIFVSYLFIDIWLEVGNYLLLNIRFLEVLWIVILWAVYLVLLLPLAVLFAGNLKNWVLRLIAVVILSTQYGPDASLMVNKKLTWMYSITHEGVISAFSLFILACFLGYAWGDHFNPNLKFIKSKNFQNSVLLILLAFATLDLFYNVFTAYDQQIWSVFLKYSIGFEPKYFTIDSFTSALEPAVLEETARYLNIIILLAGFNRFTKLRVPIAVYGSGLIFGLSHLTNVGVDGSTLSSTLAQVIGVLGGGFLWAVIYLYTGKLWVTMIFHFLLDYLIFLQSGPAFSASSFGFSASDYLFEIVVVTVPLLVTIWMMFGKRRAVLEENADRIQNLTNNDIDLENKLSIV